jgi:hypothetical protein
MLRPRPFSHAAFDYQPKQTLAKHTVAFDQAWPRVFLANGASTHAQLERLRQRLADYLLSSASQGESDPDILTEQAVRALVKRKRTHS